MRKTLLTTAAAFLLVLAACKKEEKTTEITTDAANDTTVIVHDTPPTPAPDTVVKVEAEPNGTSVDVSKDGVNINSKDGDKKTSVNVDVKK